MSVSMAIEHVSVVTFLAVHLALLDVEAARADSHTTLDAHETDHMERVLHGVHNFLYVGNISQIRLFKVGSTCRQ